MMSRDIQIMKDGHTAERAEKSIGHCCRNSPPWYLPPMILVGLTGGVATGKSTVAKMFERCGAYTIDADLLARKVVEPGTPAWRAIVRAFGKTVLNSDHTLNRRAMAEIVFGTRPKLRRLERIIHPRVAREQAKLTRQATREDPKAVVIYDVPLLFEAGIDTRVKKIIVVTADRRNPNRSPQKRNGLSAAQKLSDASAAKCRCK